MSNILLITTKLIPKFISCSISYLVNVTVQINLVVVVVVVTIRDITPLDSKRSCTNFIIDLNYLVNGKHPKMEKKKTQLQEIILRTGVVMNA